MLMFIAERHGAELDMTSDRATAQCTDDAVGTYLRLHSCCAAVRAQGGAWARLSASRCGG